MLKFKKVNKKVDNARYSIMQYLKKYPEKDFYKNVLINSYFKDQFKTVLEWKPALKELLNKNF